MAGQDSAAPINITDNAAKRVHELVSEEGNENLKLRIYVQGGGCSGLQYGFAFVDEPEDMDLPLEKEITVDGKKVTVNFLVCGISLTYLEGATIDYREDVKGSQFVITNPNANTTCGCGSSFG